MPADEEQERWKDAKAIRESRPSWVVIWLPQLSQFCAHPKFKAPAGDHFAKGINRQELEADMDRIELRCRPKGRAAGGGR